MARLSNFQLGDLVVFDAVDRGGDILQRDRRAVTPGNNERAIRRGIGLAVVLDGKGLAQAVECPMGWLTLASAMAPGSGKALRQLRLRIPSTTGNGSVGEESAINFGGNLRSAAEMADWTSWAAASISRERENCRVMEVDPCALVDVMESRPAIVENCPSRGVATAAAMVSARLPAGWQKPIWWENLPTGAPIPARPGRR